MLTLKSSLLFNLPTNILKFFSLSVLQLLQEILYFTAFMSLTTKLFVSFMIKVTSAFE